MLHYKEKETVDFNPVTFNIQAKIREDAERLAHLQKQRTKANKKRKPYWQAKIDEHFGLA